VCNGDGNILLYKNDPESKVLEIQITGLKNQKVSSQFF